MSAVRVNTDPRISRRRRAVERDRKVRAAWWIGAASLAVALVALVLWSPLLAVRAIDVAGVDRLDASEVSAAVGLDTTDNLLFVSTDEVARRVEELPWVRSARAERRLPGTVRVRVEERRPALVLQGPGWAWLLDGTGHVLAEAPAETDLPVIAGVQGTEVAPGDRVRADGATGALAVWRSLPAKLRDQVAGLIAPTGERITLTMGDGLTVRYGSARAMVAKNEVLSLLLTQLRDEGRTASYIDVRVPTSPAIGPPAPAPVEPPVP